MELSQKISSLCENLKGLENDLCIMTHLTICLNFREFFDLLKLQILVQKLIFQFMPKLYKINTYRQKLFMGIDWCTCKFNTKMIANTSLICPKRQKCICCMSHMFYKRNIWCNKFQVKMACVKISKTLIKAGCDMQCAQPKSSATLRVFAGPLFP